MHGTVSASQAEVLANDPVARDHFVIALAAPEIASAALPGQFAMLRVPGTYDPLLPRAFSFYRADVGAGRVEFLYRVVGKGTRLLAAQSPGSTLQIWGPLGHGFEPTNGLAILVGGGVGVPPLVHLAEYTRREGWPTSDLGVRKGGCGDAAGCGDTTLKPASPHLPQSPHLPFRNPKLKTGNRKNESRYPMVACFGFAAADFVVGSKHWKRPECRLLSRLTMVAVDTAAL